MKNALDLLHEDEARAGPRGLRTERRSVSTLTDPTAWLMGALGAASSKSGAVVGPDAALNVSIFRACVDLRANLFSMLPVHLMRRTERGPEKVSPADHPLARMLRRRMSAIHTTYRWRHSSSVCFDMGGNAYSRIRRDPYGVLTAVEWLRPCDVEVRCNPVTGVIAYRLLKTGELLGADEILHVANLSTNGYTGRSPLADLRESVGLALTAEEFSARSFANGNKRPGVLVGGDTMTREKAEEYQRFYAANYAGAANGGKQLFVWGMDWKDAGFSNVDAELLLTRRFSVEEIARVFHLPLHLVGGTEKSTTWGSGIEQLNRGLVDYTLAPLCKNWEDEMNTVLLTEAEQDEGYYIKFQLDAILRASFDKRATIYQAMRAIGAMDVNQIRELEDMPLYPDGWAGDPRQPLNAQGNAAMAAATAPARTEETT